MGEDYSVEKDYVQSKASGLRMFGAFNLKQREVIC